jgi:hypothetical protein
MSARVKIKIKGKPKKKILKKAYFTTGGLREAVDANQRVFPMAPRRPFLGFFFEGSFSEEGLDL